MMIPRIKDPCFLAVLMLLVNTASLHAQQPTQRRTASWAGCPAPDERPGDVTAAGRREGERLAEAATRAALIGDKTAALGLLTRAAALDPASRSTAYQLARILDELDRPKEALAAYCRYLALAPDAPEADEVRERTRVLGSASEIAQPAATTPSAQFDAQAVLVSGLLVPGLGHFRTGRPGMGVLVLGVASGALATGVFKTRPHTYCLEPPVSGECPPNQIDSQQETRPYLWPAVAVAVGTSVLGAIDAYRGANARNARSGGASRVRPDGQPRGASLALPGVNLGMHHLQLDLVRVRF
jgi:tetratricopeptide (TPR) repeat protein